jgi:hypothetical protein
MLSSCLAEEEIMKKLRAMTIQDTFSLDRTPSLIVNPEDDFGEVVRRFAEKKNWAVYS